MKINKPLFVDLDGTLIKQEISHLAFNEYKNKYPFKTVLLLFFFLFLGRSYLKTSISKNFKINFLQINFNHSCLEYIKQEKKKKRLIFLISGSHQCLLEQINLKLNLFDGVYGTSLKYNMVGKNKVHFINKKLDIINFDYIGNSKQDLPIWKYTKKVIFTNAAPSLKKQINKLNLEEIEIKENFL